MLAFRALFFLVSVLASCTFAIPAPKPLSVVHEQIQNPPPGFISNGPAPHDTTIKLHIGLKPNDVQGLEKALYDVSTPGSKKYGDHLSKSEAASYIAPSAKTKSEVRQWLEANGIQANNTSFAEDWISISVNVSKANNLFGTKFESYTHAPTGQDIIRTLNYSLPPKMANHIDVVHPTTNFPVQRNKGNVVVSDAKLGRKAVSRSSSRTTHPRSLFPNTPDPSSVCNSTEITPACIQALYGLPPSVGPQNKSRLGVAGFVDQFAQESDLAMFLAKFRPDLPPNTTFSLETLDGGQNIQNSSDAGLEANLDIQYSAGLAGGVPTTFISVGPDFHDGDIQGAVDILQFLMEQDDPPQILSSSYGRDEGSISPALANKFCTTAMALSARGLTLLYSSGDGGVAGVGDLDPDDCTTFLPTFPSGCPYVTVVGATESVGPETAADLSSGGFSDIFPMPPYQKNAVSTYLNKLGQTNAGLYNNQGRGYPDVAAQGRNISIFSGGHFGTVDGTSCSTPIFASFIAEVNAKRLQEGKKVLGFLNPMIYSQSNLFTDITSGSNPGCGTDGFPATIGWDPVTGLGTPIFSKFQELP